MPSIKEPPDDLVFTKLSARAERHGLQAAFQWLLSSGIADAADAQELGGWHQRLLDRAAGARKRKGSYYTPSSLVSLLLDHALEPILSTKASRAVGFAVGTPDELQSLTAAKKRSAFEALSATTVLDPSCGTGVFLEAARARLMRWLAPLMSLDPELHRKTASQCLFGIDSDETAAMLARHATDASVHVGDALFDPLPWTGRKFDVIVGNPPFANAIEGLVSDRTKKRLAERWPELRGTADLSFYFLAAAHELAVDDGSVGLVLPRSVLSAPAARKLRERLHVERPPAFLYASDDQRMFAGANVYVALVALRHSDRCIGVDESGVLRTVAVAADNWWRGLASGTSLQPAASNRTLGESFEVVSSMTAGEAYDLLPFLAEGDEDAPLRFVTTGLIDPDVCRWKDKICRYLGRKFQRPTVSMKGLPEKLKRRIARMRRPKALVAGLSTKVEAFLDVRGNHLGAVSTYSIMHPDDDVSALATLCGNLNSTEAARQLREELGATALGGGRMTLTKAFLKGLRFEASGGSAND